MFMMKSLTAVTLVLAMSGFARAEDAAGTGDGGQFEPVSYDVSDVQSAPMSCRQARETAWFIRELSRTDGDVAPETPFIPCGNEVLAESSVDAD